MSTRIKLSPVPELEQKQQQKVANQSRKVDNQSRKVAGKSDNYNLKELLTPETATTKSKREYTEAKARANKKWNDANKDRYDRIQLVFPKGKKDEVRAAAKSHKMSLNAYILQAVETALKGE